MDITIEVLKIYFWTWSVLLFVFYLTEFSGNRWVVWHKNNSFQYCFHNWDHLSMTSLSPCKHQLKLWRANLFWQPINEWLVTLQRIPFLLIHELFNRLIIPYILLTMGEKKKERKEMMIKTKKKIGRSFSFRLRFLTYTFFFYHQILRLGFRFALHMHFTNTFEFASII